MYLVLAVLGLKLHLEPFSIAVARGLSFHSLSRGRAGLLGHAGSVVAARRP